MQKQFDEYIEAYTRLTEGDKKSEIVSKLREMISNYALISKNVGQNHELLINKELADLSNIPLGEKDFLEGVFVYIHTLEDEVSSLINYLLEGRNE